MSNRAISPSMFSVSVEQPPGAGLVIAAIDAVTTGNKTCPDLITSLVEQPPGVGPDHPVESVVSPHGPHGAFLLRLLANIGKSPRA